MSEDEDEDDFFMHSESDDSDSFVQEEQVFVDSTELDNNTLVTNEKEIVDDLIGYGDKKDTIISLEDLRPPDKLESVPLKSSGLDLDSDLEILETSSKPKRPRSNSKVSNHFSSDISDEENFENQTTNDRTSRSKRRRRQAQEDELILPQEEAITVTGIDADDEFFKAINEASKRHSSLSKSTTPEVPSRKYNIMYISRLNGTEGKRIQAKVLGKQTFAKVLPPLLNALIKINKVSNKLRYLYKPENVTLYWNKSKLLNFMNSDSLKIPQTYPDEISELEILIISKEEEKKYEEEFKTALLEEEQQINNNSTKSRTATEENTLEFEELNTTYDEFEKELNNWNNKLTSDVKETTPGSANAVEFENPNNIIELSDNETQDNNNSSGLIIKISLLGDDNKKIFVNVRNNTKIRKLAEYYRKCKNIPTKTRIKATFDHEELDLDSVIGDEDLEDDDIIEMITE